MQLISGFLTLSTLMAVSILTYSCKNETKEVSTNDIKNEQAIADSLFSDSIKKIEEKRTQINYIAWDLKNNDSLRKIITKEYTGDSIEILRQINRTDKKYWKNKDTFLLPEPFTLDLMTYSLYPYQLSIVKDIDKFVIFSYELQIYGVYEKGKLIKWGATNMGKKATPTPTGLFFANWKGRRVTSTVNPTWILQYNFNIHNTGGVGWHQYEMPGYPASHSCLRLFLEDAMWLYEYADQWTLKNGVKIANGTPVIVFGEFPWGQSKPWFKLVEGHEQLMYTEEKLEEIIRPHIDKIHESEKNRKSINTVSNSDTIK